MQVPFHLIREPAQSSPLINQGLGDSRFTLNGILFETPDSDSHSFRHMFTLGGGIKIPTGTHNIVRNQVLLDPAFQMGSGSWDVMIMTIYTARLDRWGLNININGLLRQKNLHQYKASNIFHNALNIYYWFKRRHWNVLPQIGAVGEIYSAEKSMESIIAHTGGKIVNGTAGVDVYWKKWVWGFTTFFPLYAHLNSDMVVPGLRLQTSLNFIF